MCNINNSFRIKVIKIIIIKVNIINVYSIKTNIISKKYNIIRIFINKDYNIIIEYSIIKLSKHFIRNIPVTYKFFILVNKHQQIYHSNPIRHFLSLISIWNRIKYKSTSITNTFITHFVNPILIRKKLYSRKTNFNSLLNNL